MFWVSRISKYLTGACTGFLVTYCLFVLSGVIEMKNRVTSHGNVRVMLDAYRGAQMEEVQDGQEAPDTMASRLRISCWVMTSPRNLEKRARFIQMTWAKRCDKVVFISSETNKTFPTVGLKVSEGRSHLTEKTLGGFRYVYEHHFDDCDWFFKADDDTYLVVENLRHFLADFDTNEPLYFGHHFKTIIKQGYSSGGSGLVVSKEALRRFGQHGHLPKICRQKGTAGDAAFGQCMQSLEVKLGNSTDSQGRSKFHCMNPRSHLSGKYPRWYKKYDANGAKKGWDGYSGTRNRVGYRWNRAPGKGENSGIHSMSEYPVSFHYVDGYKLLELEYLLYRARVHNHVLSLAVD